MKAFFKKIGKWFSNIFHAGKIAAAFDKAMIELETLREAILDIAEQKDKMEAQVEKYKKQVKELKAKLKKESTEE